MRYKDQRLGIFVDIQNLYHSAKNLYQARVNYTELIKELTAGRQLIRVLGYAVKSGEEGIGEESFFEAMSKAGVELRLKDLQIFPGGMKKADWDVGMAVDAIRMASFLDAVALVTGDGDFIPLVEYLKWGLGREVEVAAFGRTTSAKLKEAADIFINLEDNPRMILRQNARRRSGSSKI